MGFTVATWLKNLGLDQYAEAFAQNDVDARVLPLLTNEDLRELGVTLGHRKVILAAAQDLTDSSESERSEDPEPSYTDQNSGPGWSAGTTQGPWAAAERRHLTVFFADLVGSTELTNRTDPEDMRLLLQQYQDAVAGAVSRYGGYVAKYLGDGLLVFFGWPRAYEDHAIRAVKAGLDALRNVKQLKTPDGTPLAARIGIASGDVVVGDAIGENTYEEGAMTGPVLNLAARIQEKAPPNSIVLPKEETAESVLGGFEFDTLGPVDLKGFDSPRNLLQVTSERSAESRFRAGRGDGVQPSLIGRNFETGILLQSWHRAQAGKGEVILLSGEAGIGKSRLIEGFLEDVTVAGVADTIRLNCSPYLTSSPFHPVTERISQDAGAGPDFDDEKVLDLVRGMLAERQGLDLEKVLPVFAALVAPRSKPAQQVLNLSPQEQRDLTIQTLISTVQARSAVRPVILFVEDAHWIDASTHALLDRFKAICVDLPLLLIITHRPGWEMQKSEGDTHVQTLHLGRFDFGQVAHLVRTVSGHEPDPALVELIVEKTDGIPLFVEELTRAMQGSGDGGKLNVPSSLQGTLMARLDSVSQDAKQTALVASVIGREFEPALLEATMAGADTDIRDCLDELCRTGLVFESGHHKGHFVFRHALIRDTAYQSMLSTTRRTQHANVAQALMRLRTAEMERRPELVARHLTEAQDWAAAFDHWRAATEMALTRSASQEAMANATETLRAAQELGDEDSVQVIVGNTLMGRAYDSAGLLPEGIAMLKEASDTARRTGQDEIAADIAHHFADSCMMAGQRHERAISLCLEALEKLPDQDKIRRCRLLGQIARACIFIGKVEEGAEYGQRCMELAAHLGDHKSQFSVMMTRYGAPFCARQGDDRLNWRRNLDRMHGVAQKLGNIDQGRDHTLSLFVGAEMADRLLVDRSLEQLTEISNKDNHLQLYWVQIHARAMISILNGDFQRAESYASEAVKIGRQTHGTHVEGVYGVQMFTIRREQSRLQEVAPVIKRLMTESPEDITWKPGFGLIAAELGFKDAAERILNEMAEVDFVLPPDAMYSTTLSYLADICVAVEHQNHAQTLYEKLLPYRNLTITAGATTVCSGAAARRLGTLSAVLGEWETAEDLFETAIGIDTDMAAPPWVAHSKGARAWALRRRGRPRDLRLALQLEAEALATAQELGMVSLRSKLEGPAS
ncbi:MAG: adenylate/guanylate cyclase domain-containing protein [Ruegeria sp.]